MPATIEITLVERPEIAAARQPQLGFEGEETPAGVRVKGLSPCSLTPGE